MQGLPPVLRRASPVTRLVGWLLRRLPASWRCALYGSAIKLCTRLGFALLEDQVVRLPFRIVLKDCSFSGSVEGDALRYIDHVPGVNAPILLDHVAHGHRRFLATQYIEGVTVGRVWDDLTASDKDRLVEDLRSQFDALAKYTASPDHPICNASGSFINDPRIHWVASRNPRVFDSPAEFLQEVWLGIDWPRLRDRLYPIIRPLIDRKGPEVVPIFCHGDVCPPNLILPGGLNAWRAGRSRICLVDWEMAGWMPAPWEALKATFLAVEEDDEWMTLMRRVFPASAEYLDADWQWRLHSNVTLV